MWGGRWESNPQRPEPQSGALPVELLPPYSSIIAQSPDFGPRTSDLRPRASDFRLRTSDFGLRTSDFRRQISARHRRQVRIGWLLQFCEESLEGRSQRSKSNGRDPKFEV